MEDTRFWWYSSAYGWVFCRLLVWSLVL